MIDQESLAGKVGVITGGSSGIGHALATSLNAQGVKLALGSRTQESTELDRAIVRNCDVRNSAEVSDLVEAAIDEFGHLDILVANAGVGHYGDFLHTPDEHIEEMIATNVLGTINLLRAGLPRMLEGPDGGDVIVIASEAGRRGYPGEAVYCASKFAQVGLMRALDRELQKRNVRCTTICPGGVNTGFAIGRGRTQGDPSLESMMTAEEVADVVTYALSRPRDMRLLEVALRPMSEQSGG